MIRESAGAVVFLSFLQHLDPVFDQSYPTVRIKEGHPKCRKTSVRVEDNLRRDRPSGSIITPQSRLKSERFGLRIRMRSCGRSFGTRGTSSKRETRQWVRCNKWTRGDAWNIQCHVDRLINHYCFCSGGYRRKSVECRTTGLKDRTVGVVGYRPK